VLSEEDSFEGGDLIPGWILRIGELFA
jgi:hypothetical protein